MMITIIAVAVSGCLLLCAVVLIILFLKRRKRTARRWDIFIWEKYPKISVMILMIEIIGVALRSDGINTLVLQVYCTEIELAVRLALC